MCGEEGEEVALGDGLLLRAWKFYAVVERGGTVPGAANAGGEEFAKGLFAVCVGGVVDGVVSCSA